MLCHLTPENFMKMPKFGIFKDVRMSTTIPLGDYASYFSTSFTPYITGLSLPRAYAVPVT